METGGVPKDHPIFACSWTIHQICHPRTLQWKSPATGYATCRLFLTNILRIYKTLTGGKDAHWIKSRLHLLQPSFGPLAALQAFALQALCAQIASGEPTRPLRDEN